MARIAVVTADRLGRRVAGPAIRATRLAEQLSTRHRVRLVSTATGGPATTGATTVPVHRLRGALRDCDVLVVQGFLTYEAPWLLHGDRILVVDLYDPMHLEQLERGAQDVPLALRVLNDQLRHGDFFLCAHEAQREFWLGQLAAVGRLDPTTYDVDPELRSLIDVVPFGIPGVPPTRRRHAIRGVLPGVGIDDPVVLWGGGVYDWLDPVTVVRAIGLLASTGSRVRLVFQGMRHPNPAVPPMAAATECRRVAAELGLVGRHIFFNEDWVPYDDRGDHLLDADIGISAHRDHLETRFSMRTRILDYLWAGLPVVTTTGDVMGELVRAEGLGAVVPAGDVTALAAALGGLLEDPRLRESARRNVARVRERYTWDRAAQPLLRFCENPRPAAGSGLAPPRMPGVPSVSMSTAARETAVRLMRRVRS